MAKSFLSRKLQILGMVLLMAPFFSCDRNDNIVLFSLQNDIELGMQVNQQIQNSPQEFPILPEEGNEEAYRYLRERFDQVLNSGEVAYRDEFAWEIYIIDQDVLNAFCTPGGYIYFYSGLIKYLNTEDFFMGVLGHEVAHADLRHTSRQMQNQYGINFLLAAIGLDENALSTLASGLLSLQYSRNFETEADEKSVEYLAPTPYACDGAKGFFQQLEQDNQSSGGPEFLSTHPSPDNRIENIEEKATEESCETTFAGRDAEYAQFKSLLP